MTIGILYYCIFRRAMKVILTVIMIGCVACSTTVKIGQTAPHNKDCYSQGLFFLNSTHLFQSCGLYRQSYFHILQYQAQPFSLRQVEHSSKPWNPDIFLEGATLFNNSIYLMTWQEREVYRLHPTTYELEETYSWPTQGWGLTDNQTHMFTSDGSDKIYLVDGDFKLLETKPILDEVGRKLFRINELEWVDGYIYANVYYKNDIVKIDYGRGRVIARYNAEKLVKQQGKLKSDEVINGIAYNEENKKFILTGKDWTYYHQTQL